MVCRTLVTEDVAQADGFVFDCIAVEITCVAACSEDTHKTRSIAAHSPAGTQQVGVNNNAVCLESFLQHLGHPVALWFVATAGAVEVQGDVGVYVRVCGNGFFYTFANLTACCEYLFVVRE